MTEGGMRIYEGSPRTDWEEVLRSVGAFADHELLKELIFLELEAGFVLQGLAQPNVGQWSESSGMLTKKTFELVDDQIGQLIDESIARRAAATAAGQPHVEVGNYYEQALRVIGAWVDGQHPRDVFFFEQDGSFVVRLLIASQSGIAHQLAEFTRDEIVAMIEAAPQQRSDAPQPPARG
jgi:hypothetical protein